MPKARASDLFPSGRYPRLKKARSVDLAVTRKAEDDDVLERGHAVLALVVRA
jgi:hypothetical protein